MLKFGNKSVKELEGVEEDLVKVSILALSLLPTLDSSLDFGIGQGLRGESEQADRVASGNSQTLHSRHFANKNGKSEAVDITVYLNGKYINGDTAKEIGCYRKVNQAFVQAAIQLGIQIELGALWRSFVDACHIQLLNRK